MVPDHERGCWFHSIWHWSSCHRSPSPRAISRQHHRFHVCCTEGGCNSRLTCSRSCFCNVVCNRQDHVCASRDHYSRRVHLHSCRLLHSSRYQSVWSVTE